MKIINNYCNPFSNQFRQSVTHFHDLSLSRKVAAVAAAVFGALATPFLLCIGGVALFQLAVKWLRPIQNGAANIQANSPTTNKRKETRNAKIEELRGKLALNLEERKREAVEQGYTVIEDPTGFSGKGFFVADDIEIGGHILQGEFVDGEAHGKLIVCPYLIDPNEVSSICENGFKNGQPDGTSLSVTKSSWEEVVIKEFSTNDRTLNGKISGRNEAAGYYYTGEYKTPILDGKATIIWDTGERFVGSGKLIYQTFEGNGKLTLAAGMTFEGNIQIRMDQERFTHSGNGKLTHPDGREETVRVENGEIIHIEA